MDSETQPSRPLNLAGVLILSILGAALWAGRHALFQAPPLHQSLNEPGQVPDLQQALIPGKVTVVHYYADWCPGCVKWRPTLNAVNTHFKDMRVQFVNIDSFDSAVAQAHGITFVPNFKIFDERGVLIAKDKAADRWLRDQITQRVPHARAE